MTLFIATSNAGKMHELRALFGRLGVDVAQVAQYVSPVEGVRSYTDNAALKARALHDLLRAAGRHETVLADDSGLEVAALGGRPGVTTADYGGAGATWPQRRALLLSEVAASGSADRRARFVCAMHCIDPAGREFASFATVDGAIAPAEAGELGFSFDPIFFYPPASRTFAQLSDEEKNGISHRAIAAAAIAAALDAAARGLGASLRGEMVAERE